MIKNSPHSFYIPVMGTGFTIDTPIAVAKYGISSVIPLTDDLLIEQMRKFWCEKYGEEYIAITSEEDDYRAKRITAYLNLVKKIVDKEFLLLKNSSFEPDSEVTKYFEMLPDCELKQFYLKMLEEKDLSQKKFWQDELRLAITPGSIDVNIMTKLDRTNAKNGIPLPYEFNDAAAALRGFAKSNLKSSLVLSAGFNPHLFSYINKFADFLPDENAVIKKKICLKVSDYRSAAIQGKFLAKHGVWVSEYRIESPLNCGGHAFINDGQLLGPILAEFKQRKKELTDLLHGFYTKSLSGLKKISPIPHPTKITVQGGIGTNNEHNFLLNHYELDAAGWATPFLLVPEVTNVDNEHLQKLLNASEKDIFLSQSSPLGVPFWNLRNSASEEARLERIRNHKPGSICIRGYAKLIPDSNGKISCTASREYQTQKLKELEESNLPQESLEAARTKILSKSCICTDLAGGVTIKNNIDINVTPAICPGPNLVNFKKISTLKEMINHIYGCCSIMVNTNRPHMFIREVQLHINNLIQEIKDISLGLPARSHQKLAEVKDNLLNGLEYYHKLAQTAFKDGQEKFIHALKNLKQEIENIQLKSETST